MCVRVTTVVTSLARSSLSSYPNSDALVFTASQPWRVGERERESRDRVCMCVYVCVWVWVRVGDLSCQLSILLAQTVRCELCSFCPGPRFGQVEASATTLWWEDERSGVRL